MKKKFYGGVIVMAIVQNPVTGKSKNKFGNAIFSEWNGLNVLRSKPLSVANPNTPAQQTQRALTKINSQVGKELAPATNVGYRVHGVGQSARSLALKENYGALSASGTPPVVTIDWSAIMTSKGAITATPISTTSATDGSASVTVTWSPSLSDSSQAPTDKAVICAIVSNGANKKAYSIKAINRSVGTATFAMNEALVTGDDVEFYLSFASSTTNAVSDSAYSARTVA